MRTADALVAVLLAAGPAAAADSAKPVTIYVGPATRDGFVEVDRGMLDSIKDIQKELRKDKMFSVVTEEAAAALKLYVVYRGDGTGSTAVSSGTATVVGGVAIGSGATSNVKDSRIEASLRVGTYQRTFVGQSEPWVIPSTWTRCARLLVKDLTGWVKANRDRLTSPAVAGPTK